MRPVNQQARRLIWFTTSTTYLAKNVSCLTFECFSEVSNVHVRSVVNYVIAIFVQNLNSSQDVDAWFSQTRSTWLCCEYLEQWLMMIRSLVHSRLTHDSCWHDTQTTVIRKRGCDLMTQKTCDYHSSLCTVVRCLKTTVSGRETLGGKSVRPVCEVRQTLGNPLSCMHAHKITTSCLKIRNQHRTSRNSHRADM